MKSILLDVINDIERVERDKVIDEDLEMLK
jgi:hypothetical protein